MNIQGNITATGSVTAGLGESAANPASSCTALHASRADLPNGIYWLKPSTQQPGAFRSYCDMANGGWTLVWSNLRGGRGKPVTELSYVAAATTAPRYTGEPTADLESFSVFTGLRHWTPLAPNGLLRYDWKPDYNTALAKSASTNFSLATDGSFTIHFANTSQLIGGSTPDLFTYHNNQPFSTYDGGPQANCAASYSNTPFWYVSCWSGSINGGGEYSQGSNFNGAYWMSSGGSWGNVDGTGAGLGWIYVN